MKQPNPSGVEKGDKIFLKDIIKHIDSFKIKDPIAWIVGGISNHGQTKGDIDILINLPPEEADSTISKVLRFRIQRSFPETLWPRIHWLYNDGAGPFTSHVPLYSLEARKQPFERKEMAAANTIEPLKFFKQLKGKSGRFKREIFTIKSLKEVIPEKEYPLEVNKKYDGMRAQIHKKDNMVKIYSEEGSNITERFPTFVDQIKKYPKDIVLDVEITGEEKGKPIGRSDVSGYVHKKDTPDDSNFTANTHDIVYLGNDDLHKWSREERMGQLKGLRFGNKYNIIPFRIADNKNELERHVNFFSNMKASEGAMIKSQDSIYELDGMTTSWWKYKKDFVIDARVDQVIPVKGTDSFNYLATIDKDIPIGKTFNTKFKAEKGDIIQVAFGNLNKYIDKEKVWYNWVFPRVVGVQETKTRPDDIAKADTLNKESGGFIEKKSFPLRFKHLLSEETLIENIKNYDPKTTTNRILLDDHRITHAWASVALEGTPFKYTVKEIKTLHDGIAKEMEARGFVHNTPIELPTSAIKKLIDIRRHLNKDLDLALFDAFDEYMLAMKKKRYVFQHHWRGKSVHGDLRFELPDQEALEGYTLAVQKTGATKEPVDTFEKSQEEDTKDIFKIDYKTGQPKEQKILIFTKSTQPKVWLKMKGATKETEPGDPPQPGATRLFPGVFNPIDTGLYEQGARKPFFREYFMNGKVFNGRYIFRKLPSTRNFKDAGKKPFMWFFWKPEEQTPYILSTRALRKQDFPVGDTAPSWLPSEWEKKIPKELVWWGKDLTREEATEKIKEARKLLKKEKQLFELKEKEERFTLDRHWWKGQKVIRDLPVEHWDLRLSLGREFTLDKNPLFDPEDINAVYRKKFDIAGEMKVHDNLEIPPGEEGNPNKKIPAHVDTLDSGAMEIIAHTENFMSADFRGKHLKGFFTFKKTDPSSDQWVMTKGKLPKSLSLTLGAFEIESIIDLSDPQLDNSRNDIARSVGCSSTAVYSWQRKANLL